MKRTSSIVMAGIVTAGLAALAGACTTDTYGERPYYGPSQGYAPYGYYSQRPYYRGYGPAYYNNPGYYNNYGAGPSITFNVPMGG